MLKTKKWVNVLVLIFTAVCILVCICASVVDAISADASDWGKTTSAVGIIALCFAGYYMAKGYSKTEANFFKIFVYLFACSEICAVIATAVGCKEDAVPLIISAVALLAVLIIAFGKNLGKALSLIVVGANFVCQAVSVEYAIVKSEEAIKFGELSITNVATLVLLSAMLFLMTYAKYVDKAERKKDK